MTPTSPNVTPERTESGRAINWHWPANKNDPRNNWIPWYVIGWRLLWSPLIYAGGITAIIGITMAFGPNRAREFAKDFFPC